ncbi:T9SS-dependent M36 family metallopeptidase [Hymenobacter sp. BT186]|uniref:T9SS-dependent M36 family metallopeptidase n=1 Tax=Hymenobacter telluris TaxID=2816474 RepID=A0A939ETJ1_9BACT|nr:T9SS-dependent M36 family metallopeptidase [Hymenobacter telluris]MBO0356972.1 T9SS-dependent M36 family metallopeptidase [Hymenobacter telluris]MBW3372999.1 T9SS-dependent M36 family metallopeptidase [Hymenobacter norwichensis]
MKLTSTMSGCRVLAFAAVLGLPTLATAQQQPLSRALAALTAQATRQGLSEQDLLNPVVTSQHTDASTGLTHIYLRQRHQGIEVYGAVANATVAANGKLVALRHSFLPNVAAQARTSSPSLTAAQGVAAAARALSLPAPRALSVVKDGQPTAGLVFSKGGISLDDILVKLMYQPLPSGELALAWDVTISTLDAQHYWNVRVDASTGALLDQADYTISEPVSFAELTQRSLATQTWPQVTSQPTTGNRVTVPNSYSVFPLTIESPNHGASQLVVNPADAMYSPFGWHDVNGVAGADSTNTKGNNVYAYLDRNGLNTFRKGASPDGGATQVFDFPFAAAAQPTTNSDAAVTNLFYWNNLMHDVMASKGFTEAAGNFQVKNYSNTGIGNDPVRAEAQDGAGLATPNLNNANFTITADGQPPRMQMYEWSGLTSVSVTAPTALAGPLNVAEGNNGRTLNAVGPITGNLVAVNDGSAQPTRGCNTPLVNAAAVNGNIALIRRGKCNFSAKIKIAQDAGARMVVMMDSIPNAAALVTMAGTAPDSVGIRIPSVFISYNDGIRLKTALDAGQTVTITAGSAPRRDGDFDNGIVAHEYGHGISGRLTGGAANATCLNNAEQMGEGWSDFFALWMTTKPGDLGTTPRGIGTYASYEPTTGFGIRTQMYSTNMALNDLTYADLGASPYTAVHAIGEIWAATLWDLNWALIGRYGYNNDLKALTGGNNVALRLVIEGLKLQGCRPGFLDGRNGILKADSALNNAANSALIWQVFARRGMGFNAVQGSSAVITDQTAGYSLPPTLSVAKRLNEQLLEVYPNPANSQILVRTQVNSKASVGVELVNLMGQVVRSSSVAAHTVQQEGVKLQTADLSAGVYVVRLTTSEGTITKKVVVQH